MKDGKTAEAGIVGNEGFTGTPAAVGLSRSASSGGTNHRGWVSGGGRSFAKNFEIYSAPSVDVESLCSSSGNAGCTNRRV